MKAKLALMLLLFYALSHTQELPTVIPQSPNAATLGEYGNTPISLNIGTPNISIPIWEIKGSKLSLPISISYRSSGIKIEDQGSNIGLGWALNAGGVITRSIKGKPENGMNQSSGKILPLRPENLPYNMTPRLLDLSIVTAITIESSTIDTEPDLFFYNFGNYSGKFVFDENGNSRIMPDSQFQIEYTTNSAADFVITDLQGNKYYFDDSESTGSNKTSWYLTKIVSADGFEEISFEYVLETFSYWTPARRVAYVDGATTNEENINEQNVYLNALRLSKINTNFGVSVDFIAGADRIDYNSISINTKAISAIEVNYNNQLIKKVVFDQEFVETDKPLSNTHYLWQFYDMSWANKRMYLNKVKELSSNEVEEKAYTFDYWGRLSNGKDSLANKMSYAQDHWGYYNGKNNNASLRPAFSGMVPHTGYNGNVGTQKTVSGADRSSVFPWSRCGTLKSITYPTGGKSTFDYEGNYGEHEIPGNIDVGGLRISKITNQDAAGDILKTKTYEYEGGVIVDYPDYTNRDAFFVFPNYNNDPNNFYIYLDGVTNGNVAENDYKLMIHSGSVNGLGTTSGHHISYRKVKEIETGNGYTLNIYNCAKESWPGDYIDTYYTYDPVSTFNLYQRYGYRSTWEIISGPNGGSWQSTRGGWPYAPKTDYSWKRGLLQEQHVYKEGASTPTVSTVNQYTYYNLDPVYGLVWKNENFINTDNGGAPLYLFYYGSYKIQFGVAKLTKQTTIKDGVTTVVDSEYNTHHMLSKTTLTSSSGKTQETTYKYPTEFTSQAPYNTMVTKNIIAPVIEQSYSEDSQQISRSKTLYRNWYSDIFSPEFIQTSKGSNTLDNRIQFHDYYNDSGQIKQVSKSEGTKIVYIWGYNNQYPVAKIEHQSFVNIPTSIYNDIVSKSNLDNDTCLDSGSCNEKNLRTALNNLRNDAALANAMVTTYTYDPLIGITSMTDPKGYTTYYEYDDFNRLEYVKDDQDNLLSENQYNYKN